MLAGTNCHQLEVRPHSRNMESTKIETRTNIKFMVKLGWENRQIIDALTQVYGDNAPKKSTTYKVEKSKFKMSLAVAGQQRQFVRKKLMLFVT